MLANKKEPFKNPDVIEVGISNHHSLMVTALKIQLLYLRETQKEELYRDFSSFNIDDFKEDFDNNLKNNSITEYSHFQNIFREILHKHAPIKKKILKFNYNFFMTEVIRKAKCVGQNLKIFFIKQEQKETETTAKNRETSA